jgi:hypothetical protein
MAHRFTTAGFLQRVEQEIAAATSGEEVPASKK